MQRYPLQTGVLRRIGRRWIAIAAEHQSQRRIPLAAIARHRPVLSLQPSFQAIPESDQCLSGILTAGFFQQQWVRRTRPMEATITPTIQTQAPAWPLFP